MSHPLVGGEAGGWPLRLELNAVRVQMMGHFLLEWTVRRSARLGIVLRGVALCGEVWRVMISWMLSSDHAGRIAGR